MKLSEHVDKIRTLIEGTFDKQFSRLGIGVSKQIELDKLPQELHAKRQRFEEILESHVGETGCYKNAREKAVDELTFTLFNRIAAIKVMEASSLFPPIITKQPEHGDRSFGHKAWLEMRPDMRSEELEGIREYIKHAFNELGETLPLYSRSYPYALLPDAISLNEIIDAFNAIEKDPQIEDGIWQSDDILGWLYESYNNAKKVAFKESKAKTEYDKVSIQSQVYTPRWVVQFLVENSLGKLYLEMYPDSEIKSQYKIANAPKTQERKPKPLQEIKLIDPSCGSGNFLLYAFDLFYALYLDQIENYGADYDEYEIPKLIIENNLHGIDLDDRAIQLAQLGLYIKARKKHRSIGSLKFNVVSSDFYLPDYEEARHIFEEGTKLDQSQKDLISDIWGDLQYAYKFGSLIKIGEKLKARIEFLSAKHNAGEANLFELGEINHHEDFAVTFFDNLKAAVDRYAQQKGSTFLMSKTRDAITFLELLTTEYDVATANPPYTDSSDFGPKLKKFIENNYKKPYKFHTNLYATFIKCCYEFVGVSGVVAMVHPPTFMYIKSFEDVRKFIVEKNHIDLFVEWGFLGMFNPKVRVDSSMYVLKKGTSDKDSKFIKLNHIYEGKRYDAFIEAYNDLIECRNSDKTFMLDQSKLKLIPSYPFIYWISDEFRERFMSQTVENIGAAKPGLQTGSNERFLRFWWELDRKDFFKEKDDKKKWVNYAKGGDYNKWSGNLWLKVNWEDDGYEIKNFLDEKGKQKSRPQNRQYYFKEGITYSATGGKPSFRILPENSIFDVGGASIFVNKGQSPYYAIALLNSKVTHYILDCLNPTSNIQKGDIDRLLYFEDQDNKFLIEELSKFNIRVKEDLFKYSILEEGDYISPIVEYDNNSLHQNIADYLNYENSINAIIICSESIIDDVVIRSFNFPEIDKKSIIDSQGESLGSLPLLKEAKEEYLKEIGAFNVPSSIAEHISSLQIQALGQETRQKIISEFEKLYQDNYNLESFCKQEVRQNPLFENINPINIWYLFKKSNYIPKQRLNDLAMEFLVDLIREIMMEDEDGIIPLIPNAGESVLLDRIEDKFREKGFSSAQFSGFDLLLGRPLNDYINKKLFMTFTDHLNLFQYLPKTPFLWHLSSGPEQGFDCYIIIYKWSRDKLMRLRSVYIEHRERALINKQSDLSGNESADAQNERERISKQLREIETFKVKIDELLAEGYDPILDDGVAKNIAPLQKKGMIPYEVLNVGQLKKYLNADW